MRMVVVIVLASVVVASAASATSPGHIVFAANRAPTWWGEIYRVGPSGKRIDLSRSPAVDFAPAVSTSGKKVAFVSERGGRVAVYVTGLNGGRITRISPFLFRAQPNSAYPASLTWSPDDRELAIWFGATPSKLYLSGPGNSWRMVNDHGDMLTGSPTWSPDGQLLAFVTAVRGVQVVTPRGNAAWTASGTSVSWGAHGRLAVARNSSTVDVFDEAGRRVETFPGQSPRWSPDGNRLATLSAAGHLQVRPGPPTAAPRASAFRWFGSRLVRLDTATGEPGYDVVTNHTVALPRLYRQFNAVPYVDGSRVVASVDSPTLERLQVSPGTTLDSAPPCGDVGAFAGFQFAPGGRTVVYETSCPAPPADIYAVAPDGQGLKRLTTVATDESQPSLSADGTRLAYVSKANAVHCPGCDESLWLADADGAHARLVARAPSTDDTPFDDSPSWSPDGSEVLFARSGVSSTTLFTADATTGVAHTLGLAGLSPVWGPQRIAYRAWPSGRLVTAAPDGTDAQPVPGSSKASSYAWSPDGRLALLNWRGSELSIAIGAKVIALRNLSPSTPSGGIAWSPDGSQIAFAASDGDGVSDLYTVRLDGTHLTRITHDLGAVSSVSWR